MSRPTRRPGTSHLTLRKRIPAAVLDKARGRTVAITFPDHGQEQGFTAEATPGKSEVTFSLRTRSTEVAKARTGLAEAHLQTFFDGLKQGPKQLTKKEAVAIAGDWHREHVAKFEDDPGEPRQWAVMKEFYSPEQVLELGSSARRLLIQPDAFYLRKKMALMCNEPWRNMASQG